MAANFLDVTEEKLILLQYSTLCGYSRIHAWDISHTDIQLVLGLMRPSSHTYEILVPPGMFDCLFVAENK